MSAPTGQAMPEDYNPLGVPKGCELRIRADRSACFQPKFEPPPPTQFLMARAVAPPAPAPARLPTLSELEQEALASAYRASFLLAMRERAKDLTQESGFTAAAVEAWESGIDDLVKEIVRHF